jgi:hypothetical protein
MRGSVMPTMSEENVLIIRGFVEASTRRNLSTKPWVDIFEKEMDIGTKLVGR